MFSGMEVFYDAWLSERESFGRSIMGTLIAPVRQSIVICLETVDVQPQAMVHT